MMELNLFIVVVLEKDLDRRRDRMSVVCRRWCPSHYHLRVLNIMMYAVYVG
jgi:hypothetical protein